MTLKDQYDTIISQIPHVMKYGKNESRIPLLRRILDVLGSPDKQFKTIHVAGTNGKGSISTLTAALLQRSGYQVGLFTSPTLYEDREMIRLNGQLIMYDEFIKCYQTFTDALKQLSLTQQDISIFETWYLISAIYFADRRADYVVYETGLGGELDATNATRNVETVIFAKFALDHLNILGSTLKDIVTTTAKIIKPGAQVVCYTHQDPVAVKIIENRCLQVNAKLYLSSFDHVHLNQPFLDHSQIDLILNGEILPNVHFNLAGQYQIRNLQTVLTWVALFNRTATFKITRTTILSVLQTITFPGRMALIQAEPPVLIDGAHNLNGINGLVTSLLSLKDLGTITFVVGFLKDKQVTECVNRLLDVNATFIISSPDNPDRALAADQLAQIFHANPKSVAAKIILADSIANAAQQAKQLQTANKGLVIGTGSFYFINKFKLAWDGDPNE